jgi:hypothetical protein
MTFILLVQIPQQSPLVVEEPHHSPLLVEEPHQSPLLLEDPRHSPILVEEPHQHHEEEAQHQHKFGNTNNGLGPIQVAYNFIHFLCNFTTQTLHLGRQDVVLTEKLFEVSYKKSANEYKESLKLSN